jgi:hypothetical protein
MNVGHFNVTPKQAKTSEQEAQEFFNELRLTIAMAKQRVPKGKRLQLRCCGCPVVRYSLRPGGLFAVEAGRCGRSWRITRRWCWRLSSWTRTQRSPRPRKSACA